MIDPQRVSAQAESILQIVETIYDEKGVALPERRYYSIGGAGSTAHDCEQVTVSVGELNNRLPGGNIPANGCQTFYSAVFVVEVVRCVPVSSGTRKGMTPTPPSASELQSYAQGRLQDVAILTEVAKAVIAEHSITRNIEYTIGFSEPGDLQGVALVMELSV